MMMDYEKTDWLQKPEEDIYHFIDCLCSGQEKAKFFLWLSRHFPEAEIAWIDELEDLRSSLPYHENIAFCEEFLNDLSPSIFEEYCEQFEFVEMDLCDHYLYTRQFDKLDQRIGFLKKQPFTELGITPERLLYQLLFSGQYERALDLSQAVWKPISEIEKFVGIPEYAFISTLYLDALQKVGLSDTSDKKLLYADVFASAVEMGFDNEPSRFALVVEALESEYSKDALPKNSKSDLGNLLLNLNVHFMKYMWKKHEMPFFVSDFFWQAICKNELYEKGRPLDKMFYFSPSQLEKYFIAEFSGFVIENQPELFGKIFGLHYVFSFLHDIEIISEDDYDRMIENLSWLRTQAIECVKDNVWQMHFVSSWPESDYWTEIKYLTENTFGKEHKEAHDFVVEYCKNTPVAFRIKTELQKFSSKHSEDHFLVDSGTYMKSLPDIGRNDPCPCGSGKKFKNCCHKSNG